MLNLCFAERWRCIFVQWGAFFFFFFLGVDDIYEATCFVCLFLLSVFAHGAFLQACCSHSDSAVCPLCFIGSVLSASHFYVPEWSLQHSYFHKFLTCTFHSHGTRPLTTYLSSICGFFISILVTSWVHCKFHVLCCGCNTHWGKSSAVKSLGSVLFKVLM